MSELSDFDNVFFEIQNEPWAGGNGVEVVSFEKDKETMEYDKQLIVRLADQESLEWHIYKNTFPNTGY